LRGAAAVSGLFGFAIDSSPKGKLPGQGAKGPECYFCRDAAYGRLKWGDPVVKQSYSCL
jgi:hypothetical protein